jgi:hypothetical protein
MIRHTLLIAGAALLVAPAAVQAQSSSLFGSRGVTGTTGTLNNGVGGNRTGTGANAAGNSGTMQGFTGATAGSQSGFLSGAQASGGLAGTGNGQFVGNRNSAAARAAGGQAGAAGGARAGANGRNSLGGGLSRNNNAQRNRGNQNGGASGGAQSTPIRPVLVIAFDAPAKTGESIATSINADLSSAVSQGRLPGVAVVADAQGIVTLSGHVPTEGDRSKAERLVRLEPGVRDVVNRITVQEQAAQ